MRESGVVTEVRENDIIVRVERKSACGENCSNCGMCNKDVYLTVKNTINANKGDGVLLEMPSVKVYKIAFLVYIIPLVALILGYYLGIFLFSTDGAAILTGFILMGLTFLALYFYDKRKAEKYKPVAISLIK